MVCTNVIPISPPQVCLKVVGITVILQIKKNILIIPLSQFEKDCACNYYCVRYNKK